MRHQSELHAGYLQAQLRTMHCGDGKPHRSAPDCRADGCVQRLGCQLWYLGDFEPCGHHLTVCGQPRLHESPLPVELQCVHSVTAVADMFSIDDFM